MQDHEQLYAQHSDSLVIIAVPSNSFGNESRSNEEIRTYFQTQYQVGFLIAGRINITGNDKHPLYTWLTSKDENGISDNTLKGDFHKFLISKSGELSGMFPANMSVNHPAFQQAISTNPY